MQQCQMNGDTFRRDDGKLYLNGQQIIKGETKRISFKACLISLGLGIIIGLLI